MSQEHMPIIAVQRSEGGYEVHHYTGDDGYPAAACFDVVWATTADGRNWMLPRGQRRVDPEDGRVFYRATYDLDEMLAEVQARNAIDPADWVEVVEPEPFEVAFAPWGTVWQEEQEARLEGRG